MPLTDTAARSAKPGFTPKGEPTSRPYKLADAAGLYLEVQPHGGKYWRLKYRFGGKEKRLSLGVYLSAEALVDWARSRISHYKVPRYVEFVDTFPLTASGKAQKYLMRQEMTRRLGLSESQTA